MFALIIGVYYAIKENDSEQTPAKESPIITNPSSEKTVDSKKGQISSIEKLVEETFSLSKEGKVPNISFRFR